MKRTLTAMILGITVLLGSAPYAAAHFPPSFIGHFKKKRQPKTIYEVVLYHPTSGKVVERHRFDDKRDAQREENRLRSIRWVYYRYDGINEKLHIKQFASYIEAKNYRVPARYVGPFRLGLAQYSIEDGTVRVNELRQK